MIAHRLNTLKTCDMILVLENGMLVDVRRTGVDVLNLGTFVVDDAAKTVERSVKEKAFETNEIGEGASAGKN